MSKFHLLVSSIIFILATLGETALNDHTPTNIRVYLHEFPSGPNATEYEVARANITAASPTSFGSVRIGSNVMTSEPNMSSGTLGWAEGLIAYSGRTEGAALLHLEFLFKSGTYNGSSIGVLGRKVTANVTEEIPISGGTGQFLMARGYALSHTYSYDPVADYIIYLYDFYIYLNRLGTAGSYSDE